jgi:hypothetical protein
MAVIDRSQIEAFLMAIGQRCEPESVLFLIGGGALELLGGARPTVDIDYVGDDLQPNKLQQMMAEIADEMHLEIEGVPIGEFVPIPKDAEKRAILVGQFGNLAVHIFDPYTIALSKLDRGFETDLEDILFLIQNNLITLDQLKQIVEAAVSQAHQFELNLGAMNRGLDHLQKALQ